MRGNLAAVVALKCRDLGGPAIRLQLLVYPIANDDLATRSYIEYGSFTSPPGPRWPGSGRST